MKGTDDAALNAILLVLFSWVWVPVLLIGLLAAQLMRLGELAAKGLGHLVYGSPTKREIRRIYAERDASYARIEALGYEAELRMLQAARGDYIDGTAIELPD